MEALIAAQLGTSLLGAGTSLYDRIKYYNYKERAAKRLGVTPGNLDLVNSLVASQSHGRTFHPTNDSFSSPLSIAIPGYGLFNKAHDDNGSLLKIKKPVNSGTQTSLQRTIGSMTNPIITRNTGTSPTDTRGTSIQTPKIISRTTGTTTTGTHDSTNQTMPVRTRTLSIQTPQAPLNPSTGTSAGDANVGFKTIVPTQFKPGSTARTSRLPILNQTAPLSTLPQFDELTNSIGVRFNALQEME